MVRKYQYFVAVKGRQRVANSLWNLEPKMEHIVCTNLPISTIIKFVSNGADSITPEILNRIKSLMPVTLSCTALTKAINEEFEKNCHVKTICYQAKKAMQEDLGGPNEDANNFIRMLEEEEAKNKDGFYQALIKENKFKKLLLHE